MTSKIRIKMGAIEVEYEGSQEFLKKDLQELLSAVAQLYTQSGCGTEDKDDVGDRGEDNDTGRRSRKSTLSGTTATIAGKLGAKSAPDLIIAAAAHLALVANKSEFSRKELHEQMKGASGYYKNNMQKNFTNYLNNRLKAGELVEPRTGHYALSSDKVTELRKSLAT
jgi:hypothetical protein